MSYLINTNSKEVLFNVSIESYDLATWMEISQSDAESISLVEQKYRYCERGINHANIVREMTQEERDLYNSLNPAPPVTKEKMDILNPIFYYFASKGKVSEILQILRKYSDLLLHLENFAYQFAYITITDAYTANDITKDERNFAVSQLPGYENDVI